MAITAAQVKELREKTGAGMMDCKKALTEKGGDMEEAITYLREKGLAAAKKKAGRVAAEGIVYSYIHPGGSVGVLLELNCETDFVAKTDEFKAVAHDIAMHIAAAAPGYVKREEVAAEDLEKEREIYKNMAREEGKPENILDKIADGKINKFYKENCLLEQEFVKNPDLTIEGLLTEKVATIGENISVRRFSRYKVGEGIEVVAEDFAAEVAAQL